MIDASGNAGLLPIGLAGEKAVLEAVVHGLVRDGWQPARIDFGDGCLWSVRRPERMLAEAAEAEESVLVFDRAGRIGEIWVVWQGDSSDEPIEVLCDYTAGEFGETIEAILAALPRAGVGAATMGGAA